MDILTSEHLKPYFAEFLPSFKNAMVGREDIGNLMKSFSEENRLLKKPRRMWILSYFAEKRLLTTSLARWYLNQGLEISEIYEFIKYAPKRTFKNFGLEIAKARRVVDVVVRASALQSVDLGFIPLVESYQKTLKNGIRSFPA